MMFIDTFWMGFLAWYLANIWPSEYGTHKPWYFLFLPSYWGCNMSKGKVADSSSFENSRNDAPPVEAVADSLHSQIAANNCVHITNLYKEFETTSGTKVAVDNLSLTMYSGQITALLGHNGAGKTTTIAMLTGLLPTDRGTAIIEGLDINKDMDEIRRNLGVCPQHDIVRSKYCVYFASCFD